MMRVCEGVLLVERPAPVLQAFRREVSQDSRKGIAKVALGSSSYITLGSGPSTIHYNTTTETCGNFCVTNPKKELLLLVTCNNRA